MDYPKSNVDFFAARAAPGASVISHQTKFDPPGNSGSCVECLGYISEVVSLVTASNTSVAGSAAGVKNAFKAGSVTFTPLPDGTQPVAGDIGVNYTGGFGHIIIVKELKGKSAFVAIESNQGENCKITSERAINFGQDPYTGGGYIFFRKQ